MKTTKEIQSLEKFLESEINQIQCDLQQGAEMNIEELEWSVRFAEKIFPNSVLMLCNARHKKFEYISEACKDILGYTIEQFHAITSSGWLTTIHPDDVSAVSLCFRHMVQCATDQKDFTSMRFMLFYRLRHAHGHYLHISDEKIVIESRKGNYVGFTLLRDVSATTNSSLVRIEKSIQKGNRFIKINEYVPSQGTGVVSVREQDVVTLIKEGFSNKDIAMRLSLSVNTIKNHKKSVFKKLNVRSSLELMRHAAPVKPLQTA
jgi:DNA-binding CsgD family transcriptional regulator